MGGNTSAVGGPLLWIVLLIWWAYYEIKNPILDRKGRPEPIVKRLMPLWILLTGIFFIFAGFVGGENTFVFIFALIGVGIQFYAMVYGFLRRRKR